ncbi:unnamed protein product, partial [Ectocarpus fasciculatus]
QQRSGEGRRWYRSTSRGGRVDVYGAAAAGREEEKRRAGVELRGRVLRGTVPGGGHHPHRHHQDQAPDPGRRARVEQPPVPGPRGLRDEDLQDA